MNLFPAMLVDVHSLFVLTDAWLSKYTVLLVVDDGWFVALY